MRYKASAFYSQQRCAAVFRMVKPLLEVCKSAARKQKSDLPRDGSPQGFFQGSPDKIHDSLGCLERNVAHKTVGDNHINLAAIDVPSFDVADKIQRKLLQ